MDRLDKAKQAIQTKLNNPQFMAQAPEAVIQGIQDKYKRLDADYTQLTAQLKASRL